MPRGGRSAANSAGRWKWLFCAEAGEAHGNSMRGSMIGAKRRSGK